MPTARQYIPFLKNRDHFFGIEIFGSVMRGSLVAVDSSAKHIQVLAQREQRIESTPLNQFVQMLPILMKQFRLPVTVRVIGLLDHRRATTLVGAVSLMRSDAKAELSQAELANLVSQGVWKLANSQRAAAARKMDIPEIRAQLVDADVVQVRLNGHRVVNPVGFTARAVELFCRETFVDSSLATQLHDALTDDNLAVVAEAPVILASLIARRHPQQDFLLISAGTHESVLYQSSGGSISFVDSVLWGTETLLSGVARQFSVSTDAARAILERYSEGEISRTMAVAVEKAASGELAILTNAIGSHQPREGPLPVYVHAAVSLPSFLFDPAFNRRLGFDLSLTEVNERFIGNYTGFVVQWQQQRTVGRYTFETLIAAVADTYTAPHAAALTAAAKQRARWTHGGMQR